MSSFGTKTIKPPYDDDFYLEGGDSGGLQPYDPDWLPRKVLELARLCLYVDGPMIAGFAAGMYLGKELQKNDPTIDLNNWGFAGMCVGGGVVAAAYAYSYVRRHYQRTQTSDVGKQQCSGK